MRNALRLLVLALVAGPSLIHAQKKEDILEIQRDIAQVDEKVRALQNAQTAQDKKLEAIQQLVQQAATTSAQLSQDMAALKTSLTSTLNTALADQQSKLSMAVSPFGTRMDALSKSIDELTATVGAMNDRVGKLDGKLKDISDQVSTINKPLPPPPVPVAGPDAAVNGVPPGITKTGLREDAERDYGSAYSENALKEFASYIKYFPDDEYSPTAGYLIGMVYSGQLKDYDSAVDAFQHVIDTWPANNKAQDALFQKAVAQENGGHRPDAIRTFTDFINMYPANDYIPKARADLAKLKAAASQSKGKGRGPAK